MNTDTMELSSWYEIDNIESIDSPAFIIYPDRVKKNILLAISMVGDVSRLRPHAKTNKSKEACLAMITLGVKKFKCATIAEAEMLALCDADDVLLAYQPLGPKLARFLALIRTYPGVKFSCLVDNEEAAKEISGAAKTNGLRISFYLDINVGMNRTGVSPGKALALFQYCLSMQSLHLEGLHVYDGHIHENDFQIRKQKSNQAFLQIQQLKPALEQAGSGRFVIIAGGSPTFPVHAERERVECSPGTFIYWDRNYQLSCPEQLFEPAALVITRVVSLPTETTLCLDLGHKSIASENDLHHRVYFLNAPELKCVSHSEEHLVVEAPAAHGYRIGDVFYVLPFHICPTAALYERAITIQKSKVVGEWKMIARDRKISC